MSKHYCFKPYNDKEYQIWILVAAMLTIVPLFADDVYQWYIYAAWGVSVLLFWMAACKALLEYHVEVTVSEEGIRIGRGKYDVVPFARWNTFESAWLLDVSWTDKDQAGFRNKRYAAYYVVLVKHKTAESELQKLASRLSRSKPCGKVGDFVVFRSGEEHNALLRQYIGEQIAFVEMKMNEEGAISRL